MRISRTVDDRSIWNFIVPPLPSPFYLQISSTFNGSPLADNRVFSFPSLFAAIIAVRLVSSLRSAGRRNAWLSRTETARLEFVRHSQTRDTRKREIFFVDESRSLVRSFDLFPPFLSCLSKGEREWGIFQMPLRSYLSLLRRGESEILELAYYNFLLQRKVKQKT